METKKSERFADLRLAEAINSGAEILATSCPYCILNFEDSLLAADNSDIIQVKDISELVAEAL